MRYSTGTAMLAHGAFGACIKKIRTEDVIGRRGVVVHEQQHQVHEFHVFLLVAQHVELWDLVVAPPETISTNTESGLSDPALKACRSHGETQNTNADGWLTLATVCS